MSSKKLVNEPLSCVAESLSGYVMSRDDLQMIEGTTIVVRKDLETLKLQNKVVLITGGGSGHEPAHIGYVGRGMLTAAVCGGVFASPTSSAVLSAILTCATPAGVLLIVKNYTGDRLNFGKALEVAKQRNVNIRMVVVGEDCALVSRDKSAGRRGLCATILVHKIAGEMAEQGKSLDEIFHFVQQASKEMGTISISLSSCSIPGKPANFAIAQSQIEFGLGIHGEAGIERIKMEKATVLVKRMIDHILHSGYMPLLKPGSNVVVVVNNLGSTTDLELYVVAREALQYLKTLKISVDRCYVGTFVTSLDMAGVSISLMMSSGQRLSLLDAPTDAPRWSKSKGVINEAPLLLEHPLKENEERVEENTTELGELIKGLCTTCCNKLLENEEQLNMLDRTCGDGDTGTTLASGAKAILSALESRKAPVNSPHKFFNFIGHVIENVVGGSSGAKLRDSNKMSSNFTDPRYRTISLADQHKVIFDGAFSSSFAEHEADAIGHSFSIQETQRVENIFKSSTYRFFSSGDISVVTPWASINTDLDEVRYSGRMIMPLSTTGQVTKSFIPCGGIDPLTNEIPTWAEPICVKDIFYNLSPDVDFLSIKRRGVGKMSCEATTDYSSIHIGQVCEGDIVVVRGQYMRSYGVGEDASYKEGERNIVRFKEKFTKNVNKQPFDIIKIPKLYGRLEEIPTRYLNFEHPVKMLLNKINMNNIGTLNISFKNACFNSLGFLTHDTHIV